VKLISSNLWDYWGDREMNKRHTLVDIIVTAENVIPVVQQHEELLPHIKEKIDGLVERINTLYHMNWIIILLMVAILGEKGMTYLGKLL
jgi:hypothetical protein